MANQEPLRILCLDGGGVRGLSSLHLLQELMATVRRQDTDIMSKHPTRLKPHRYFDLICGTSTGGLIALMLGRLQYGVEDAIVQYNELCEKIFTSNCPDVGAAYDHEVLANAVNYVIDRAPIADDRKKGLEDTIDFENDDACRTFVVTTRLRGSGSQAFRMRTYNTIHDDAFPAEIWEAARATSAAPTFFLPIKINGIMYGDGGTGWNNPTSEALSEAHDIWPNRPIACLISLGTGLEDAAQLKGNNSPSKTILGSIVHKLAPSTEFKKNVAEYCVKCLTSCEVGHQEICSNLDRYNLRGRYFRLNVPQGMSHIGLEEWNRLEDIATLAEDYMRTGEMRELKQLIAKLLRNPWLAQKVAVDDMIGREKHSHMRTLGLSEGEILSWQHSASDANRLKTSENSYQGLLQGSAKFADPADNNTRTNPSDQEEIEACNPSANDSRLGFADSPRMVLVAASNYNNEMSPLLQNASKIPPCLPSTQFGGRAHTTDLIKTTLAPGSGNDSRIFAICGPAGVGKTEAAGHFVWAYKHLFDVSFWVRANSPSTLRQDFLDISMRLGLEQNRAELSDATSTISNLKTWLGSPKRVDTVSWLIVLDGLNDVLALDDYIPMNFAGSILITSRDSSIDSPHTFRFPHGSGCYLFSLNEDEAVALLLNVESCHRGDDDRQGARTVASRLGNFPAALAKMTKNLARYEVSFQDYLETHNEKDTLNEILGGEDPDSENEIDFASNWKLQSFNNSKLLAFLAFLDCKYVTEDIFKHKNMDRVLKGTRESYERERYDLSKCSLIHINRGDKALSMEPLIQNAVLSRMSPERFASAYGATSRLLLFAWPFPESYAYHGTTRLQEKETLIHHICRLPKHAQDQRAEQLRYDEKREMSRLIASGSQYLTERGNFRDSKYLSDFVVKYSPVQGLDVASCLYTLGCIALEQSRCSDAEGSFSMLSTLASILQDDRDNSAETCLSKSMAESGLGLIAVLNKQWKDASARFEESINGLRKAHAPMTSVFLSPQVSWARVLCRQERFPEAEDAVNVYIAELVDNTCYDPSLPLAMAYYTLGNVMALRGCISQSIEKYEWAIQQYLALGCQTQPWLADCWIKLATQVCKAGEYERAISSIRKALQICRDQDAERTYARAAYTAAQIIASSPVPDVENDLENLQKTSLRLYQKMVPNEDVSSFEDLSDSKMDDLTSFWTR